MTRPLRTSSSTGIHHVMLRGMNRQIIFEQSDDYQRFINLLRQMVFPTDELGRPLAPRCRIYAYCLMPNHVHLVIRDGSESLSAVIKRIAAAYALYYNKKYDHYGHLFQDRFKSEPVNDEAYFIMLLRYVHQNPVAGGLCQCVEDYKWSSWEEYNKRSNDICEITAVTEWMSIEELKELVNEPLSKAVQVLDYDRRKGSIKDDDITEFLVNTYGLNHPIDLQLYSKDRRTEILRVAREYGASIKQLSRLTGIGEKIIRNAQGRKGS